MADRIGVQSVDSLKQFKTAMVRFRADASAALEQAEGVIKDAIARMQDLRRDRSDDVRAREDDVEEAESELRDCESSGEDDDCPDYSEYERALRRAERQLQEARQELRVTERSLHALDQVASLYSQESRKLRQQLSQDWVKATARLDRDILQLQSYVARPIEIATDGITSDD